MGEFVTAPEISPNGFLPLLRQKGEALLVPENPEFSLYAFIKLRIYDRLAGAAGSDRTVTPQLVDSAQSGITARRLHFLMNPRTRDVSRMERQFSDFLDMSSYFVRERLKNLNHGTVLREAGRSLRRSVNYEWNEPVEERTLASFRRLRELVCNHLSFAPDMFRVVDEFGTDPFGIDHFVRLFQSHRGRFIERRWYNLATGTAAKSPRLTEFLRNRLEDLTRLGLLAKDEGTSRFQVTPRGFEAAHWFELFMFSVSFQAQSGQIPA